MVRKSSVLVLVSSLAVALAACGGEEGVEERAGLELLGGKADIPTWLTHIPADWGCAQTLSGKFKGYDSAHLYSFPGKIGYEYTFTFKGTYPASAGAVVAVYDSETGVRVAYQRSSWGNTVAVTYKAARSIKYLVAVYSISVSATGSYTLAAACKVLVVTCQYNSACKTGEFCRFDAGCGKTGLGACTPMQPYCPAVFSPVCGCDGKTYGNSCQATAAGVSVDYKSACKAPAVTVSVDKAGYQVGDLIKATVANGGSESAFLGGCSVFSWQKQVNGAWVDQGPDRVCFWEGYAKELKAAGSFVENLSAMEGTWRLAAAYGVGCTAGKPLSSAGCKATFTATSKSFVVKMCPKNMPNPSAVCPTGKMVSNYDAEGICVVSYGCVPCQVADCGPAMGMPNKLCLDGVTTSGPTGKCLGNGWGGCVWEVLTCPALQCKPTGCSGQICSPQDVMTTCEYLAWYACFAKSECGTFGTDGACAWKQTPDYVSCLAQHGKTP